MTTISLQSLPNASPFFKDLRNEYAKNYRIKEDISLGGDSKFYIQYKNWLGFWRYLKYAVGSWTETYYYKYRFDTLDEAVDRISKEIETKKEKHFAKHNKTQYHYVTNE